MKFKHIVFMLSCSFAVMSANVSAKSPINHSVDIAQTLNGLNVDELQVTLELYQAQVNQDNVVLLGNMLSQQLRTGFANPEFKSAVEQAIGVEYSAEQAKVLTDFAEKQLPNMIEKHSPILGKQLEYAVQHIDAKQVAEVINEPEVKKNIGRAIKLLEIFQEK